MSNNILLRSMLPMAKKYIGDVGTAINASLKTVPSDENNKTCYVIYEDESGVCQVMMCSIDRNDSITEVYSREPLTDLLTTLIENKQ